MSEIRANTVSNAAGTGPVTLTGQSAAKAWMNFNGNTGGGIRSSFNGSSFTDNGTGNYTVNLTNAMSNSRYTSFTSGRYDNTATYTHLTSIGPYAYYASALSVYTGAANTTANYDFLTVEVGFFGDLA